MEFIGKKILNYKIISKIGEGGMGIVYLGEHITLPRKVAIKILNPVYVNNSEIRQRFLNEAITLSKLNHNNIVTLYDCEEQNKNLFLIMEYAEGDSLDNYIEYKNGPIPELRCKNIFKQILSGFSYAHTMGIIHRDIKPSNIILCNGDIPKILDFGIAKIIDSGSQITRVGTRMGSMMYMSPEQVTGKEINCQSDIYSLGVTLFEMVTGKSPYDDDNDSEYGIQKKIVEKKLPLPSNVYPYVSNHIENVIFRATAKEPSERFQSCDEFISAIEDINFKFDIPEEEPVIVEQPDDKVDVVSEVEELKFDNNFSEPEEKKENISEPGEKKENNSGQEEKKEYHTEIIYETKKSKKKYYYVSFSLLVVFLIIIIFIFNKKPEIIIKSKQDSTDIKGSWQNQIRVKEDSLSGTSEENTNLKSTDNSESEIKSKNQTDKKRTKSYNFDSQKKEKSQDNSKTKNENQNKSEKRQPKTTFE